MWPTCINHLSPRKNSLEEKLPNWIEQAFNARGILNQDEMFVPLVPISVLGTCKTSDYTECPNTPEHHVEAVKNGRSFGKYYWFDFDIIGADNQQLELRMVLNEGDADCNDGFWGAVWERNTQELVVNILSSGDMETTIEAIPGRFLSMYKPHGIWIPILHENRHIYAQNLELEKLVDLGMQILF